MGSSVVGFSIFVVLCQVFSWWWCLLGLWLPNGANNAVDPFSLSATSLVCFGVLFETWEQVQIAGRANERLEGERLNIVVSCGAWLLLIGLFAELAAVPLLHLSEMGSAGSSLLALIIPASGTAICVKYCLRLRAQYQH
jgi:hypothetical protein